MWLLLKKISRKTRSILEEIMDRLIIFKKDLLNKWRYGWSAPLFNERIWVDPREIDNMIEREEVKRVSGLHRSKASGVIVDWSEVKNIKPITDEFRIQYCYKHWKEGKSWEELGVIDFMTTTKKYGPWPRKKIEARFKMLDQAFRETKELGRLKNRKEINPSNFREEEGILVHIGTDGKPFFGGNGFHRLAIAKVLELEQIPVCVGLVDRNAIPHLDKYRNPQ